MPQLFFVVAVVAFGFFALFCFLVRINEEKHFAAVSNCSLLTSYDLELFYIVLDKFLGNFMFPKSQNAFFHVHKKWG